MLTRILISAIMLVAGYIMVWKSDWFLRNVGGIESAEKYLSTEGGSRLMYKLIGILIIVIGALYLTGLLEPIGASLIRTFIPAFSLGTTN
ncbi:MAG: hypothetical protein V1846_03405 [Candidatus Komeilibacteria bacterium]